MAIKFEDQKQNRKWRGFARKNFGADDQGGSFLGTVFEGATLNFSKKRRSEPPLMLTIMSGMVAALGILSDEGEMKSLDFTFDQSEIQSAATQGEFTAYSHGAENYLVQNTAEGTRIYAQHTQDLSTVDDVYVPLSADEAHKIAYEIGHIYRTSLLIENENIWAVPEGLNEPEIPQALTYEDGVSVAFLDSSNTISYVIADNLIHSEAGAVEADDDIHMNDYQVWLTALYNISQESYLEDLQTTHVGTHLEELNGSHLLTHVLSTMGMLMGAGAVIGAGAGVRRSRQNFNKALKPK